MASLFGPGFDSPQVHNIEIGCQNPWQPFFYKYTVYQLFIHISLITADTSVRLLTEQKYYKNITLLFKKVLPI